MKQTANHQPSYDKQSEDETFKGSPEDFINKIAPHLGRLFGINNLVITVGNFWSTNLVTGEVTVDPSFFFEHGFTEEMSIYATLHEVAAHLREVVAEPKLTSEVLEFKRQGSAQSIFHNIFSDISGNNLIHAVLPKTMPKVAKDLYQEKLFPEGNYSELPMHIQFLYKIIRDEMIPGSQTEVKPEVDEAIRSLRNYQGEGDLIKYSTAVAKSRREAMQPQEKFQIWQRLIYPVYEELLKQDKQDSTKNLDTYYQDYYENRHPEPFTDEEHKKFHEYTKQRSVPSSEQQPQSTPVNDMDDRSMPKNNTDDQNSIKKQLIDSLIQRWSKEILQIREVFMAVVQEKIDKKRSLSRNALREGLIIDPNRLAQTVIDTISGIESPSAFNDYEQRDRLTEQVGNTDWVFMFDESFSMTERNKSKAALDMAVIFLEALAAMQRAVEETEKIHDIDLELNIRTAVITFGDGASLLKPLSKSLNSRQRFDIYSAISKPQGAATNDYKALEIVQTFKVDPTRKRIIVVITDGESSNSYRAKQAIDQLRASGWSVIGISIGSSAAVDLYQPTSRRVDDPSQLPKVALELIEQTHF